ncbi:hypothetical protein DVG78_22265 [Runella aurantiaca]|uniref:Uncharacterized protein n=1 Tax=Runella aurantiaca TaxID=2282308 RepID=A0A369I567_9BACT|nr:hypothetical protein DVG78_22265 [Runella aurantiaca]
MPRKDFDFLTNWKMVERGLLRSRPCGDNSNNDFKRGWCFHHPRQEAKFRNSIVITFHPWIGVFFLVKKVFWALIYSPR